MAIEYHPYFVRQFAQLSEDEDNLDLLGEINALTDALDQYGHEIEGEGENQVTRIPEPEPVFSPDEFLGANAEMAELRQRVLDSEQGRRAYDNLTAEIDAHIDRRRARLGEVRRAVGLTQEQMAATLGIGQAQVSKIERSVNLQLETLERFIMATGGRLRVIAAYDDIEIDIALDELAPGDRTEAARVTQATVRGQGRQQG